MVIGIALMVIAGIILFIWISIEVKRLKHKMWAILLISFILFAYISFVLTLRNQDINYKSFSGMSKAVKIYFTWLGSVFGNFKSLTGSAIKMDWMGKNNQTN